MPYITLYPLQSTPWKVYKYTGETSVNVYFSFTTDLDYSDLSVSKSPTNSTISVALHNFGEGTVGVSLTTDRNVTLTFNSLLHGQMAQLQISLLTISSGYTKPTIYPPAPIKLYNDGRNHTQSNILVSGLSAGSMAYLSTDVSWLTINPVYLVGGRITACTVAANPPVSEKLSVTAHIIVEERNSTNLQLNHGLIGYIPVTIDLSSDSTLLSVSPDKVNIEILKGQDASAVPFTFWSSGDTSVCLSKWESTVSWASVEIASTDSCTNSPEDIKNGQIKFDTKSLGTGNFTGYANLSYKNNKNETLVKNIYITLSISEPSTLTADPISINVTTRKNKTESAVVSLVNGSNSLSTISITKGADWSSLSSVPANVPANSTRTFTVNMQKSSVGTFYDIIDVSYTSSGQTRHVSIPVSLIVDESVLTVDAGADITMQSGRLVREGIVSPGTDDGVAVHWNTGPVANSGTGTTLIVDFPSPTETYQDYEFELEANCSSCNPDHLTDKFKVRVINSLIDSFSINPVNITIDLTTNLSPIVDFTTQLLPSNILITRYNWSDEPNNPVKVIPSYDAHKSVLSISSWPVNGTYQINCEVETPAGTVTASSIVQVTGSSVTVIPTVPAFINEDDFYGVEYFIADTSKTDGVSEVGDISQQTISVPPHDIPVPCAYPSICSPKNNRRTGSNEQYIYVAYQAFILYKWQIYLRQIRLSPSAAPSMPTYLHPYSSVGEIINTNVTTLWSHDDLAQYSSSDTTSEIDFLAGKIYWFDDNVIYRANLDGTVEETLYTYSDGFGTTTDTIEDLKIDPAASSNKLYFVTKSVGTASYYHRLFKADPSNVAGTVTQTATYSSTAASTVKISISKDYVYSYWSDNAATYMQLKTGGSLTSIRTGSSDEIFGSYYGNNKLYIINTTSRVSSVYDPATLQSADLYTFPAGAVSSSSKITVSTNFAYISNPSSDFILSWNLSSFCVEYRINNSDIVKAINYNETTDTLYWSEKSGDTIVVKSAVVDNLPSTVLFKAVDIYKLTCTDETGIEFDVTRIRYNLISDNHKVTHIDLFGYYHDVEITVSYKNDLTSYWHDPTLFNFTDVLPNSTGSNLTNLPFEKDTNDIYIVGGIFLNLDNQDYWRLVENSGPAFLLSPGYCGEDIADPVLVAYSTGHCTKPKIACNYNNDLFIAYEDTETNHQQIKIVGTGDFAQNSPIGATGSFVTDFFSQSDFRFLKDVTERLQGVNQLADVAIDKSNVVHLTWQSNRDKYWEIYYANSTNCFYPKRITQSDSRSMSPSIDVNTNGSIYVAYNDDRFGKNQILVSHKDETRTLPLLQQDEYLASLSNEYTHYIDQLTIPVKNNTSSSKCIHVFVNFFDNRLLTGDPSVTLSTLNNPSLFQILNETSGLCADGSVFVPAFDSVDIILLASQSATSFSENQTYFISLDYVYDGQTIHEDDTYISYSCLSCTAVKDERWFSSFYGYSDTRITDSTGNALNPRTKIKSSGKLFVLWEDDRSGSYKILGSMFDSSSTTDVPRSSGGTWFDYDYDISGKNNSFCVDLFDRILTVYEKEKEAGTKNSLPTTTIAYKVCDFNELPSSDAVQTVQTQVGDYSSITSNVLVTDPLISAQYIKKIVVLEDYVDYYTRNASGASIPIVSECEIKIGLTGTPEVTAYRIKNENETNYSDWIPFKPDISNYYTEISHKLSPNPGVKEVCIQAATYSGITTSFYLTIIGDYDNIPYNVILTKKIGTEEQFLPTYLGSYVASTMEQDFIEINVYIVVPSAVKLTVSPTFDVLQQGFNDIFGVVTGEGPLPENTDISGTAYKGTVKIYKEDGKYNRDGVARIKPRFESGCISELYRYQSPVRTDNDYNYFGEVSTSDVSITSDVLHQYRDEKSGKIGVPPDTDVNR